jgi:hypothetical protein
MEDFERFMTLFWQTSLIHEHNAIDRKINFQVASLAVNST